MRHFKTRDIPAPRTEAAATLERWRQTLVADLPGSGFRQPWARPRPELPTK
jgi:hypothetical protein